MSKRYFLYDNSETMCREIVEDGKKTHWVSSNMLGELAALESHAGSQSLLRKFRAASLPWEAGRLFRIKEDS